MAISHDVTLGRKATEGGGDQWEPTASGRQGSLYMAPAVCAPGSLEQELALAEQSEEPVSRLFIDAGPPTDIRSIVALKDSFLAICGELCDILSANQDMRTNGSRPRSENAGGQCTVGIMLCGLKVQNTLMGGPSAGLIEKGDVLLRVDGESVTENDVVAKLRGSDIPGSQILITVDRRGSTSPRSSTKSPIIGCETIKEEVDVLVTRMATSEIADRRRMFDLFTTLEVCIDSGPLSYALFGVVRARILSGFPKLLYAQLAVTRMHGIARPPPPPRTHHAHLHTHKYTNRIHCLCPERCRIWLLSRLHKTT